MLRHLKKAQLCENMAALAVVSFLCLIAPQIYLLKQERVKVKWEKVRTATPRLSPLCMCMKKNADCTEKIQKIEVQEKTNTVSFS